MPETINSIHQFIHELQFHQLRPRGQALRPVTVTITYPELLCSPPASSPRRSPRRNHHQSSLPPVLSLPCSSPATQSSSASDAFDAHHLHQLQSSSRVDPQSSLQFQTSPPQVRARAPLLFCRLSISPLQSVRAQPTASLPSSIPKPAHTASPPLPSSIPIRAVPPITGVDLLPASPCSLPQPSLLGDPISPDPIDAATMLRRFTSQRRHRSRASNFQATVPASLCFPLVLSALKKRRHKEKLKKKIEKTTGWNEMKSTYTDTPMGSFGWKVNQGDGHRLDQREREEKKLGCLLCTPAKPNCPSPICYGHPCSRAFDKFNKIFFSLKLILILS